MEGRLILCTAQFFRTLLIQKHSQIKKAIYYYKTYSHIFVALLCRMKRSRERAQLPSRQAGMTNILVVRHCLPEWAAWVCGATWVQQPHLSLGQQSCGVGQQSCGVRVCLVKSLGDTRTHGQQTLRTPVVGTATCLRDHGNCALCGWLLGPLWPESKESVWIWQVRK